MMRPPPDRLRRLAVAALLSLIPLIPLGTPARAQKAPNAAPTGQFFSVVEPINDEAIDRLRAATGPVIDRAAAQGAQPVLVFEFRPGSAAPGQTTFGAALTLQEFLGKKLGGAGRTVAYVPRPLSGYAVLAALACDDLAIGPDATLGPIRPEEGATIDETAREAVRGLARVKGKPADLLLGMLDPDADLRRVRLASGQTRYVLAENLPELEKTQAVLENEAAWEGGRRGVLTAERARGVLAQLVADDRAAVAAAYRLPATTDDPTLGGPVRPILIRIQGQVTQVEESYLRRKVVQAKQEGINLIIFDLDSEGGLDGPADKIADTIARLEGVKTVAYINERALGVSTLIALACDEIVFHKAGRLGEVTRLIDGRHVDQINPALRQALADRAQNLARQNGYPEAIARALFDPALTVVSARDARTGAVAFVTDEQARAEPDRYQVQETVKPAGAALVVTAENARPLGLSTRVVNDVEGLRAALQLGREALRVDAPTWVDSLVALLNTAWMSWLLLFVGMFMLILELKLPGVGLPAIISALAFLLFFWGHYLGGTADALEILLFLVGLICLALELFVFPGFGVFGMSGILLILSSVVMASHTFIWPTQEYEYRQMGQTLLQVTVAIVAVTAGALVLGRYFPSLPIFRRMVLMPEPPGGADFDPTAKPPLDPDGPLSYLLGEVGRTTTVLKPTGRARFGELLVDVMADGFYVEAGEPVEVIEVRGSRVIVRRA